MATLFILLILLIGMAIAYERFARWRDALPYQSNTSAVPIEEGSLNVSETGEGESDTTLIFVSTLGGGILDWSNVQPALSERVKCLSYDRAGYLTSPCKDYDYSIQNIADDLKQVIKAKAGGSGLVFVAHGFGTVYVRQLIAQAPDLAIKGFIMIEPSHDDILTRPQSRSEIARLKRVRWLRTFGIMRLVLPRVLYRAQNLPKEVRAQYYAENIGNIDAMIEEAEQLFRPESALAQSIGEIPLMIISRSPIEGSAQSDKWEAWQQSLLSLSSGPVTHHHAEKGGTYIQIDEPEFVKTAIGDMLNQLQNHN